MKYRITNKNEFNDLSKHIKENKSYNVTIQEAKVRETGFNDKQLEQIVQIIATTVPQIIATTVPPLIEAALVPINKRLDRLEDFAIKQLAFNEEQRVINAEQKKFNEEQRKFNKKIEADIAEIKSLPTIAKELKDRK